MIHPHRFADYRLYYVLLCNLVLLACNIITLWKPRDKSAALVCGWVFVFVFMSFFVVYARQISHVRVGSAMYWTGIMATTIGLWCFAFAANACSTQQARQYNLVGAACFVMSSLLLIGSAAIPYHKMHELPTVHRSDKAFLVAGSLFFLVGSVLLYQDPVAVYLPVGLFVLGRICFIVPSAAAVQDVPYSMGQFVE